MPDDATITVASSSRDTRRLVGPLAWAALEELALRAVAGNGGPAVETSVRDLAAVLGAGKDAVATALTRLARLGLVRCQTQRAGGRYSGSSYLLEVDACRRAGLVLNAGLAIASPCPPPPCPAQSDTVRRDTVTADNGATPHGATAPDPTPRREPAPGRTPVPQSSLFDLPDLPPTSSIPEWPSPLTLPADAHRSAPIPQPDPSTSTPSSLPRSSQPDTSAPEVRQGGVQR
jgi:hypothetical protein